MTDSSGKKSFKAIGAFVVALFVSFLLFPATINTANDAKTKNLKKEILENEEKLKQIQKDLAKKRLEEQGVKNAIAKIDKELRFAEQELETVERTLSQQKAQGAYLEKQYAVSTEKFEKYREKYEDRLVAYYKNGRAGYMEVLFNSSSFSDMITRLHYLQLLTKHDLAVINELRTLSEDVIKKKGEVEENIREVGFQKDLLAEKKTYYEQVHSEKKKAINEIQEDIKLFEEQEAILQKENKDIENKLRSAQGQEPVVSTFTGQFGSPVCGRTFTITSPFGPRKSPKRGASSNHKGLDLRAAHNTDICSAGDGVVFVSTYGRGYGNYIIIRHGSGYATVYGHAKKNLVKAGDKVYKGQVIQKADSTGISTGSHLHFEIRKDGVAIEPSKFFCGYKVTKGKTTCR